MLENDNSKPEPARCAPESSIGNKTVLSRVGFSPCGAGFWSAINIKDLDRETGGVELLWRAAPTLADPLPAPAPRTALHARHGTSEHRRSGARRATAWPCCARSCSPPGARGSTAPGPSRPSDSVSKHTPCDQRKEGTEESKAQCERDVAPPLAGLVLAGVVNLLRGVRRAEPRRCGTKVRRRFRHTEARVRMPLVAIVLGYQPLLHGGGRFHEARVLALNGDFVRATHQIQRCNLTCDSCQRRHRSGGEHAAMWHHALPVHTT